MTDDAEQAKALPDSPVDIANFVVEVRRFSILVEPLVTVTSFINDIRTWRLPNLTLTLWIVCNFAGLILSQSTLYVLVACLIFFLSAVNLFHVHTQFLDKFLPDTRKNSEVRHLPEYQDDGTGMSDVKEFRISLIQLYGMLVHINRRLCRLYAIIKWENITTSLRYHCYFCGLLICLCVLPMRWTFLLLSNWFLLAHRKVHRYMRKHGLNSVLLWIDMKTGTKLSPHKQCDNKQNLDSGNSCANEKKDKDEYDSDSDCDDESGSSCTESANESDSQSDVAPSKPGMVSRLLRFRKAKQQILTGQCFGCKSSFTSILKRRYYCRHCGNHFCARCCSHKVPRSVFGATAPAAQTETVLVCNICHALLMNKEAKVC